MFVFANAKDDENKRHYLVANTEQEILNYCWKPDPRDDLEIVGWPKNPPPFTVIHHYEWIGKGKRPAQLQESKPFNYEDPTWVAPEKW
jgi:hypothetical protein|tara:strand:+ start:448 stop:711 length:264 start_codon:yes stop_codon:yes gene_type:complete